MTKRYESIKSGLDEVLEDVRSGNKKLDRRVVEFEPVKEYKAKEVKKIRNSFGFSQSSFADYLGVSKKTVEAWEAGTNRPAGAASRLLRMMELDHDLIKQFPFIKQK